MASLPITTDVELFLGPISQAVCHVYARWTGELPPEGCQLVGTLTGPQCIYGDTLPATSRFADRGPGGPPLAQAIVPEPCFWTPEMPQLYQAQLTLSRDGDVLAEVRRMFGIRPLGALGSRLRLDGKTWVLRGVRTAEVRPDELAAWHESETALVVRQPDDALCEAASRIGVLIVAELDHPDPAEIRRLNRWPAVAIVSIPSGPRPELGSVGHNLLLAERLAMNEQPAPWANVAIWQIASGQSLDKSHVNVPVLAMRTGPASDGTRGRAGCDRLQAELASWGQLAGYIV